jgi:beta-galactosidase/beta-glucuronidase
MRRSASSGSVSVLTLLLVALAATPACAAPPLSGPPAAVPLATGWELAMDPGDHGVAEGRPNGGGPGWRPTTVPGVFDPRPLAGEFHGTVGWYRVTFDGPRAPGGYGWALRFGSVRRVAEVWLNGRLIGRHADPYVPFDLPASGLRPGQPNTLVVRVDNRKGPEPREGWWNWGGIIRPVALVPRGRIELDTPGLMYRGGGIELFDGWLVNRSSVPLRPAVVVSLRSPSGTETRVARGAETLAPGERLRLRFSFRVPDPQIWAPDDPKLYRATIETLAGSRVEQRDPLSIGLRTVRVVGGRLEVNGRPVRLRGASILEDVEGRGPALTEADMNGIVAKLKAIHANVTRSHYLLNDRLLDRLDAAGILVWQQSPIYHRDVLLRTPAQRAAALDTVRDTVLAARVHPSVVAHSVANELSPIPETLPGTRTFLDAARRLVPDLDPSVPPAVDILSYPGLPRSVTYSRFPLLGINTYFGWYAGKPDHPTGDLAALAPFLQRTRRLYPHSALVMTEFGAEATEHGPPIEKQTYEFQTRFVDRTLRIVDSLPFMGGAIYWTLQEFAVKPHWDGGAHPPGPQRDSIHHKGLITYDGRIKPAWRTAERFFAAIPVYRPVAARPRQPADPFGWVLVFVTPLGILGLLVLCGWALRDIWRFTRPPEADVVELPRRRAA